MNILFLYTWKYIFLVSRQDIPFIIYMFISQNLVSRDCSYLWVFARKLDDATEESFLRRHEEITLSKKYKAEFSIDSAEIQIF